MWGTLCNLKCGNGVIDPPYETAAGVWRTETCDLGDSRNMPTTAGYNTNAGLDYQNACSSTCQVRGTQYWDCQIDATTKASTCYYLCGNGWLDLPGQSPKAGYAGGTSYVVGGGLSTNEPCDLLSQPYTAQTKTGYLNYVATWALNYIRTLSPQQNLGCTIDCKIRTDSPFVCPANNNYRNRAGNLDLLCSDRC